MKLDPKTYLDEIDLTIHFLEESKALLLRMRDQMAEDPTAEKKLYRVGCSLPDLKYLPLVLVCAILRRLCPKDNCQ